MPNNANLSKKSAEHVLYAKTLGFCMRKCPFFVTQTSKSWHFVKGNGPLELVGRVHWTIGHQEMASENPERFCGRETEN